MRSPTIRRAFAQNPIFKIAALKKAGFREKDIYIDRISGATTKRPERSAPRRVFMGIRGQPTLEFVAMDVGRRYSWTLQQLCEAIPPSVRMRR